jgi:spermidine/putrescine transport system substrate-binding protein
MKKFATACAFAALMVSTSAWAQNNQLNLFIWSEYIDPEIISDFEKEYDCKVIVDLYEDNESALAKLQGGGDSQYDIVVPSDFIIPAMIGLNLLAPLDHGKIPNISNLDGKFINPTYDPGNKYSVAYQWGTVGIYIRKGEKPIERTWGLLLDESKSPGPFLMMDSIREMIGSALRYKGYSVNSTNPEELLQARTLLLEAKKRSLGFEGGVGGKNKVLSKTVNAAVVYNGDAVRGMTDDPETEYFVPDEGGVIWCDNMCIPAKAPHREMSEKFINFILDAKVGARLSNFNQYATPNKAAREFITPDDLNNSAIYPSEEMMGKLEFIIDAGDAAQLYDEIWTQVKSE